MTILDKTQETGPAATPPVARQSAGTIVVKWLTTTDHKTIGTMYFITSFAFFIVGGVMALIMRA